MVDKNFLVYMYNHTVDVDMCGFHKKIVRELQRLESGEIKRLAVFLPPRFGKTLIATLFSAWYLEMNPSDDIIYASYRQERSDDALKTVAVANKSLIVKDERPSIGETNKEGSFYPMAVRGFVGGGRGADLIVMDDIIKDKHDAASEVNQQQKEDWFINGMHPRLYPDGKILLIGTRWGGDDINSFILRITESDNWTVLNFPAITDGKSIFENSYPLKRLNAIRKTISVDDWEYLYQQGVSFLKEPGAQELTFEDPQLYAELEKLALQNGIPLDKLIKQMLKFHYRKAGGSHG